MDRDTQVSSDSTAVTGASEPSAEPQTEPTGDGSTSPGATGGGGATGAKRRRRRGGRGRGRGSGSGTGGANRPGPDASDQETSSTAEPATSAKPDEDTGGTERRPAQRRAPQQRRRPPSTPPEGSSESADASDDASASSDVRDDAPASADAGADGSAASPTGTQTKRRRRRGGRGRGKKPAAADGAGEGSAVEVDPDAPDPAAEALAEQRDDAEPDATDTPSSSSRRRRRRKPAGEREPGTAPNAPKAAKTPAKAKVAPKKSRAASIEEQVAAGGPTRRIRATRTRTGRDGRRRREPLVVPPRITDKLMVITERGDRDQIAVLEEDVLVQHYVTRAGATSMVGNVYLGRVQNVLPGMEAAFVDVGRGRNGVLYAGEVNYSPEDIEGPAPRIEQLLKAGQAVMVQVTKDPMGGKGARLTANLSLAGRYLVLAPNQNLQGISRRLPEEARARLKTLLKRVKPPEHGVIVRTAAEGATEEALEADLRRLLEIWETITKKAAKGKAPDVLYEEPELTVRVVRDLFTDEEYRGLVTDSERVYRLVTDYVHEVAPDLAEKVTLHTGPLSAFEEHRIVEQIHKALDRKVWLPSGGYLIIERTEAMTIIDVNTGKSVGKTNLEETVVNTNLEAARESARQLRLRDIGGIIVIDFIDMLLERNKKQVEDTMREALAIDKTRSQVFEIGPLGLMQVTRKRVSSGLVESFSETCPTCEGRGIILTYDTE
ncbi:MAG TPA: Rne/Rng family ribonuclease [Actinomycetota bacterium]|nr:Rne/Rng family ribonuclease [Actinomycetota bacterium]